MGRSVSTVFRHRQRKTETAKPLRMTRPPSSTLPILLAIPLATLVAIRSWAAAQADPTMAAEGAYLGLVATWIVTCVLTALLVRNS